MNNNINKLKYYIDENLSQSNNDILDNSVHVYSITKYFINDDERVDNKAALWKNNEDDIDNYINKYKKYNDFQTMLFNLIDKKELKDSDVYNKVHIDRRLFSKIRNDNNYHPSKETIILLALSLELSEKELDELLESASYSLPRNNEYDLIIRFCFKNNIFKVADINELLYKYNCKLFNY